MTKASAARKSSPAQYLILSPARARGFTDEFLAHATRCGIVIHRREVLATVALQAAAEQETFPPMFAKDGDEPGAGNTGARRNVRKGGDGASHSPNQPLAQLNPARIPINVEGFGPAELSVSAHVYDIAVMVHADLVVCPHVIATLRKILAKYPELRFGTFLTAMRLVELATRESRGTA